MVLVRPRDPVCITAKPASGPIPYSSRTYNAIPLLCIHVESTSGSDRDGTNTVSPSPPHQLLFLGALLTPSRPRVSRFLAYPVLVCFSLFCGEALTPPNV